MSSEFWIDTPNNLWRFRFDTIENILNSVTLIILIVTIVCSLLLCSIKPFYFGAIAIAIVGCVYYIFYSQQQFMDTFSGNFPIREPMLREPTPNNPFMNVPVTDYDKPQKYDDYQRYDPCSSTRGSNRAGYFVEAGTLDARRAARVPHRANAVRDSVSDNFNKGLYMNPSDALWERESSQRQYVSQPIGSVPQDSVEFGQWLYGNTDSALCKQGSIWSRYGIEVPNNCNGANVSVPTNFGIKAIRS